ncbi:MAG: serine/threonine protein kinase [Thermomicrobiales bacterium]|nr:serine/threonine protein kinase [Thermomicrobiales bacterium]
MSGGPELDGPPPVPPGAELLPNYRVVGHLRRGRDLDVYDIWSEVRACRVIAKTVRPDRLGEVGVARRLLHEGRLLKRLSHPHIVRAYEVHPGPPAVVIMETLHGETLAHLSDRVGRLPARDLAHLGLHLASALHYLHQQGTLHLDLKPGNVIAAHGLARLIDLSLAHPPGRALPGRGTRGYMAPEQVSGSELTPATDVWALGALLFELATGHFACHDDENSTSGNDGDDEPACVPVPVRTWRRLPRRLGQVIDCCLQDRPDDRPSLPEVSEVLEAFLAEAGAGRPVGSR